MDNNLTPPLEGLLADGSFEVWHVDFGWQNRANFLGSRELVFQALCRETTLLQEAHKAKQVKIRVLNDYIKFTPVTKQTLAIGLAFCWHQSYLELTEMNWLAELLRCRKELAEELVGK